MPDLRLWTGSLDLVACCALVGAACLAAVFRPDGSGLRMVLALAALFVAPGYLLVEAAAGPSAPAARPEGELARRARRLALAIGLSPALVGLVALATAGLPGGFRAGPIVLLFAVTCFALAGAAWWRRSVHVRQTAAQPTVA